ncbi:hypothetical protein Syun_014303 [Stephania yunnanensis]|uniref:Pentatricopeptide repeat-containing protein n=1 Tax=Stephania yunnanensis TaxID=152371 RepID=A0AAP0JKR9_9MAGN
MSLNGRAPLLCSALYSVKAVHSKALKTGQLLWDLHLSTRLLNGYTRCGGVDHTCQLFDEMSVYSETKGVALDVVCWNSIITGLIHGGRDVTGFQYFNHMRIYFSGQCCRNDFEFDIDMGPDSYTLSSLLSSSYCLEKTVSPGMQLHGYAVKSGVISGISVGNALITLYATWRFAPDSRRVFESMPWRNVVSWTAIISGYAQQNDHEEESLRAFVAMMREDLMRPNQFTLASIFSSCSKLGSLSQGLQFIALALKIGLISDIHVQNSIVGFYSECGCVEEAKSAFESIANHDLVSWNSLLKGYSQLGRGEEALVVFKYMLTRGETPDSITFLSVLSACRHTGMVSQGIELLRAMKIDHGIEPQSEHISCVIDLLARAGQLRRAKEFIEGVQCELGDSVWRTLLGACRVHGNVELAELAASKLLELDYSDREAHVVLSNVYAARGDWKKVGELRKLFREKGGLKEPGRSWIEGANGVHSFVASDWNHPSMNEIRTLLMFLTDHIRELIVKDDIDCWV